MLPSVWMLLEPCTSSWRTSFSLRRILRLVQPLYRTLLLTSNVVIVSTKIQCTLYMYCMYNLHVSFNGLKTTHPSTWHVCHVLGLCMSCAGIVWSSVHWTLSFLDMISIHVYMYVGYLWILYYILCIAFLCLGFVNSTLAANQSIPQDEAKKIFLRTLLVSACTWHKG